MRIHDRPLLTSEVANVLQFTPPSGSSYVYRMSVEARSTHADELSKRADDIEFVQITDATSDHFRAVFSNYNSLVHLRSASELAEFWARMINSDHDYLDITGLPHHVWAPLLKAGLNENQRLKVVYVEPGSYTFSATPTEGEIFDLSERISGISPLPGFASLADPLEEEVCFVALLGFEGTRFAHVLENVQPPGGKLIPIIGVPGFQPEYPFHTYLGNQAALIESRAWMNIRFARANCPFSLFYSLEDIAAEYPNDLLKIAPIGTKPHALGAILFALNSRRDVELVYDHPIRKAKRTSGSDRLLVYDVTTFMNS